MITMSDGTRHGDDTGPESLEERDRRIYGVWRNGECRQHEVCFGLGCLSFNEVALQVMEPGEIGTPYCVSPDEMRCCWQHAVLREGIRRREWTGSLAARIVTEGGWNRWLFTGQASKPWVTIRADGAVTSGKTSRAQIIEQQLRDELMADLQKLGRHVQHFDHLERFGGRHRFVLSRLYRIGREACLSIVVDRGSSAGRDELANGEIGKMTAYDHAVINAVEEMFTGLPSWVTRTLWLCRPFYAQAHLNDRSIELPFDPNGSDSLMPVANLRESVARLVELAITVREERLSRIVERMKTDG